MHTVIDLIGCSIMILAIIVLGEDIIGYLGGSLIGFTVCAMIYCVSYIYKILQTELSLIAILVQACIGYNILAYLETERGYPFLLVIVGSACFAILLVSCYIILCMKFLRRCISQNASELEDKLDISKAILFRLLIFPIMSIALVSPTGVPFLDSLTSEYIRYGILTYVHIAIFCIISHFAVTLIILRRIDGKYFQYIYKGKEALRIFENPKAVIFVVALLFILLGSGMEVTRGHWILWAETVALLSIVLACIWSVWKVAFERTLANTNGLRSEDLESPTKNPKVVLKYIGALMLYGLIYMAALLVILQ